MVQIFNGLASVFFVIFFFLYGFGSFGSADATGSKSEVIQGNGFLLKVYDVA